MTASSVLFQSFHLRAVFPGDLIKNCCNTILNQPTDIPHPKSMLSKKKKKKLKKNLEKTTLYYKKKSFPPKKAKF